MRRDLDGLIKIFTTKRLRSCSGRIVIWRPQMPPHPLSRVSGEMQHEDQHFGDRRVELGRNLVAKLDMRQRTGEHFVFLDRNTVCLGDLDDLFAERSPALGDDARRTGTIIVQRDRKLILGLLGLGLSAHDARSRKCPARAATGGVGAPSRTMMSPGCNSARASAWLSCETPARN